MYVKRGLKLNANIKLKSVNIDKLLRNMIVIVDSREQNNSHITNFLMKKGINFKIKKLQFGDYSCELSSNIELGLPFDISLENDISIEKKNSLDELANNFTAGRTAFENEFIRAKEKCKNFVLLIENASWSDINNHNYSSLMNEKALYNSLISWRNKYKFQIDFIDKENCAKHIVRLLQDQLKKVLEF